MKKNTNNYLKYNVRDYLESIVDIKDKKVLDFGCNHANFLPWDGDYTGYDIDKQVIEQNKINYPNCTWLHRDVYNWQYNHTGKDRHDWSMFSTYDIIFAFSVFTHTDFNEFRTTIRRQKRRLLNKNGNILATYISLNDDNNLYNILNHRKELFGDVTLLIKELRNLNNAVIAVERKSKELMVFKNIETIPKFTNETYFLSFYEDNFISEKMNADIVDNTHMFAGIMGSQKCLYYTRH